MSIFDSIDKLITEHGSAAILSQQLSLAKDQFINLERKVSDLQTQVGRLDAQLDRERTDHKQAREDLQRLKDEYSEEVCIHRAIEFRRGKRTRGNWMPFCPKCHLPAVNPRGMSAIVCCSDFNCKWEVSIDEMLPKVISELPA